MKAFHIVGSSITVRDHHGDLFSFQVVGHGTRAAVRLATKPRWKAGSAPADAAMRIELASYGARAIARDHRVATHA